MFFDRAEEVQGTGNEAENGTKRENVQNQLESFYLVTFWGEPAK